MKKVFQSNYTGALVLVNEKNSLFYEQASEFTLIHECKTKKEVLEFIEDYWEENYIQDEQRIFMEDEA